MRLRPDIQAFSTAVYPGAELLRARLDRLVVTQSGHRGGIATGGLVAPGPALW
jgi:hypothetical protein